MDFSDGRPLLSLMYFKISFISLVSASDIIVKYGSSHLLPNMNFFILIGLFLLNINFYSLQHSSVMLQIKIFPFL